VIDKNLLKINKKRKETTKNIILSHIPIGLKVKNIRVSKSF